MSVRDACLILAALVASVRGGQTIGQSMFPYQRSLQPAGSAQHEIGSLRLDTALYAHTDDSFANVRLYDSSGRVVPFLVRPVVTTDTDTVVTDVVLTSASFENLPGNRIALVYDRTPRQPTPDELTIATPNTDFEKSVSVGGSNDRRSWTTLATGAPIFDYSRFVDVRNTSVRFAARQYAHYRIEINKVIESAPSPFAEVMAGRKGNVDEQYRRFLEEQQSLRVDKVSFAAHAKRAREGQPASADYRLTVERSAFDTADKATRVVLRSSREPLRKLTLETNDVNFRRSVTVEGTNDAGQDSAWQQVAGGEILRIRASGFVRTEMAVAFPCAQRFLRYRVSIQDNDNEPLHVVGAVGSGDVHDLRFFHRGRKTLTLCYGAQGISEPSYDVAAVLSSAPPLECGTWTAGPQIAAAVTMPKPAVPTRTILVIALGVMVAVLVYVLVVAARRLGPQDMGNE